MAGLLAAGYAECVTQESTLDLSSATGRPGYRVILNLTLSHTAGDAPASIQWTFGYSQLDFTAVTVSPGPAAGDKVLSCRKTVGHMQCILWGENSTSISNGVVADVSLTVSSTTRDGSSQVQVQGGQAADSHGMPVPMSTSGGTVIIVLPGPTRATRDKTAGSVFDAPVRDMQPTPAQRAIGAVSRSSDYVQEFGRTTNPLDAVSFLSIAALQTLGPVSGIAPHHPRIGVSEYFVVRSVQSISACGHLSSGRQRSRLGIRANKCAVSRAPHWFSAPSEPPPEACFRFHDRPVRTLHLRLQTLHAIRRLGVPELT